MVILVRKHDVDSINLQIDDVKFMGKGVYHKGGMVIYWSSKIGFGTLEIIKRKSNDKEGSKDSENELILTANTEGMDAQDDKAFTSKLLNLLVEKLTIVD